MVKKSILTALLMLGAYHFLLPHISHRFFKVGGQQRANYLRAQRYVYDVPAKTNVILGSSMSLELNDETLGPAYCKLTLPGGSILTGMEIIRRAGKQPAVVLIETNQVSKNVDWEFLHDLFSPWLFGLRHYFAMFREEGRPSNFVNGIVDACVQKGSRWSSRLAVGKGASDPSPLTSDVRQLLFSQLLRIYHEQLVEIPSGEVLTTRTNRLADYVDDLTRNGSTCVFFEMPIDSSLAVLPSPTAVRRTVQARFPQTKYHWLSFERDHSYETRDGVHLVPAEADRLTKTMVNHVNQITHQPAGSDSSRQPDRRVQQEAGKAAEAKCSEW